MGWCQGALARTAEGVETHPNNRKAVCWCPEGALDLARSRLDPLRTDEWDPWVEEAWKLLEDMCEKDLDLHIACGSVVAMWNDTSERTKEEAVEMMASLAAS